MKSKLVKYPFKDGKRYRWDTYKMGKKFEYTWAQSEPNNYNYITPYIKTVPYSYDSSKHYAKIDLANKDLRSTTKLEKGDTAYKFRYITLQSFAEDYVYAYGTCVTAGLCCESIGGPSSNTGFTYRGTHGNENKRVTIWVLEDTPIYYYIWDTAIQNPIVKNGVSYNTIRWGYYINEKKETVTAQKVKDVIYTSIVNPTSISGTISGWTPDSTEVALSLNNVDTIYNSMVTPTEHSMKNHGNIKGTPHYLADDVKYWWPGEWDHWYANPPYDDDSFPGVGWHFNYVCKNENPAFFKYDYLDDYDAYSVDIAYRFKYSDIINDLPVSYPRPANPAHELNPIGEPILVNPTWGYDMNYGNFGLEIVAIGPEEYILNTFLEISGSLIEPTSGDITFKYNLKSSVPDVVSSYKINLAYAASPNTYIHTLTNSELSGESSMILADANARNYQYIFNYWKPDNKWCAWYEDYDRTMILPPNYIINENGGVYKQGTLTINGYNVYDAYTVLQNNVSQTITKRELARNNTSNSVNDAPALWPCNCYLVVYDNTVETSDKYLTYGNIITNQFAGSYGVVYEDWQDDITSFKFIGTTRLTYLLRPEVKLIGDQNGGVLNVPSGNTTILSYTMGEPTDRQHLNPKTLQFNAPCEYEDGVVISKTWLTFNSYTAQQWANGYHFQGNQWNNIGSPWAYTGNMLAQGEHKMTFIDYEPCEPGTYLNILTIANQSETVVTDTLGNTFSASNQTYYDNVGNLYKFVDDFVTSNNRNAYPDNGYKGRYLYILQPQLTKFIQYTNSTKTMVNCELFKDRYTYTHANTYYCDRSYEGTVTGTPTSTGEDSIPDANWRKYMGLYLGESIPLLGIVETNIPDSKILGIPAYDKQVNTSETLKYGTVASASVTFTVNEPVDEAMLYNNEWLILYYDFEHNDNWTRVGFFYVDSVESIDENTSRITAHDETYKLNKYVDDFLESYTGEVTLGEFYHDLLDYCNCYYDTKEAEWRHYILNNVYHAIKTTGVEVAHFIAAIAPGFVHTNIDGDIVLDQYENTNKVVGIDEYANLQYNAYYSDLVNKVRITSNNVVIGEDTHNYGENIYFISDNPLISTMDTTVTLNGLADTILSAYRAIPRYRPAELQFLILPSPNLGEIFTVTTIGGDSYKVIVMGVSIDASGVKYKSYGTQAYPVEAQSNSQFINLINDIDSVSVDVDNIEQATQIIGQQVNANSEDIDALEGRMSTAEGNISTLTTSLQNKISNDSLSTSNNLSTIKINGTTATQITNKTYVDNAVNTYKNQNSISSNSNFVTVKINNNEVPNIALKSYVDAMSGGNVVVQHGTLTYGYSTSETNSFSAMYIGSSDYNWGLFYPVGGSIPNASIDSLKITNGVLYGHRSSGYTQYTFISFVLD